MALPDFEILFLKTPLYEVFSIEELDLGYLFDFFHYTGRIDFYCPFCKKDSTFEGDNKLVNYKSIAPKSYADIGKIKNVGLRNELYQYYMGYGIKNIKLTCTRHRSHIAGFQFHYYDNSLTKIGQFPSISELKQEKIKKYRKVLSPEQYKELNRGIGLTSHGVGIGSYVYLRRIFENLIYEAIHKSIEEKAFSDNDFEGIRMNEKINLLKQYLPQFLYENKEIYGLLSKGIHELSENECLEFFPVLQVGIELILDEKHEAVLREEKKKKISKELDRMKNKFKNK